MARKKSAARKPAKKRSSSTRTTKRRTSARRASPAAVQMAPAMPSRSCSGLAPKWKGLGLFFIGALVILNGWRGWTTWPVFIGLLVGLKGLWIYFKYG
ncbi:hypothetical protein HOC01_01910 [archaeon]|jgi:hypothetical protein|nr:hypothetical protein [archaeon]MBT6697924.1 hypothetical protein [archaeon]